MESKNPLQLYGTAWKENQTAELTKKAIENGFTAIDTANYPTAYEEKLTGDGIAEVLASGTKRGDLFIQTKFTPVWAHEKDKIPFNPHQSIEDQIKESIQQSLQHLQVTYIDSVVLHVPYPDDSDNILAWKVLETFVPETIGTLGVSNFGLPQLKTLYETATLKPTVVQNRFYRENGFDIEVRDFCMEKGITYQAFYMLKHNPEIMESDLLASVAEKLGVEKELAFYVLILGLGKVQVLNGTTNSTRMVQDTKVINHVFSNEALLHDLQAEITEFRKLLKTLVLSTSPL